MAQNRNGAFAPKLSLLALAVAACLGSGAVMAGAFKGPSTSISPYNVPSPGVDVISIVTVNDPASVAPAYKMVGVPDGLGAYDNSDG